MSTHSKQGKFPLPLARVLKFSSSIQVTNAKIMCENVTEYTDLVLDAFIVKILVFCWGCVDQNWVLENTPLTIEYPPPYRVSPRSPLHHLIHTHYPFDTHSIHAIKEFKSWWSHQCSHPRRKLWTEKKFLPQLCWKISWVTKTAAS